ncbi:lipase secretion chaperone [Trinickia caryophylli]|uniref:Lipase chaperone n=1 Tax=Trinickia caryophylli TaxID=28094 RepID=A0A1X7FPT9_TRICW|nr:lipase secretion chaperone [Trinickia caryophylli]PMS09520.1 lipase chaperone [Trinickia caryophylli]TRX14440.1 lipase chaperone [Trinickia caryophylli]WQE14279.1 lipase secretion chaperone [Trinickia caryophylli]SMF56373.1 Lipase chaperone LimK [Trinickia caryophylli]GLU33210.1 lipase chaperone [Trinickia caryophylli]
MQGRRIVAAALGAGLVVGAVIVALRAFRENSPSPSAMNAVTAAAMSASVPTSASVGKARPEVAAVLPDSFAGTAVPHLPLDARGHLAVDRVVRDFFDYFLTAQHQMPAGALDAAVRRAVAAQLDGTPAQDEALDLWRRYGAYRDALERLAVLQQPAGASGVDLEAARAAFAERAVVASRTLGPAWSEAFFGREWRHAAYAIERLRIMRDGTLNDAQKAARLSVLVETLPPDEREALRRETDAQATIATVASLDAQASGLSTEALRARAAEALGAQAAARIVEMHEAEAAWRARYADYATQRARIDAMPLAPDEREAQRAKLRERTFSDPGERVRAASLDRTAD